MIFKKSCKELNFWYLKILFASLYILGLWKSKTPNSK